MIGERIGPYRILKRLGKGGMGAVWLAEHEQLRKRVAIKVLLPEFSSKPQIVTRFVNEARAAAALKHPGIIDVIDFAETSSGIGIIMEFLEGESVDERLDRVGRMKDGEVARLGARMCSALGAAHARGIIHRDLKPQNLFILPDEEHPGEERTKILDFGIAKLAEDIAQGQNETQTGAILGTPKYMSPEQTDSAKDVDARSDVYSLCCVFFRMLTGQAPFEHKDNWRVMSMHMNLPAPSPREMNPSIHPEMERIVLRGLAKDPAERFQSMEALRDALLAGPWAKVTGPIAVKSPDATFELMTTKLPIQGDTPSGPLARMASSPSGPSGPQPPAPSTTLGASAGEVSSRMRRVTLADASGAPPILPPGVAAPLEGRRMRNVLLAAGAVGIVGGLAVGIAIMFSNNEPGSTDTAPTTAAADDDEPRVSARKARTSDPEAEAATTAPVVRTDAPASAAESPAKTASVAVLTPEPAPATAEAVADVHTARVPGGKDGGEKAKPAATPRGTYLKFDVSPPGTRILVDGKSVGTTPLKGKVEVAPGRHTLDFVLPGKPAKSFAVDAVAGKTTPVVRKL